MMLPYSGTFAALGNAIDNGFPVKLLQRFNEVLVQLPVFPTLTLYKLPASSNVINVAVCEFEINANRSNVNRLIILFFINKRVCIFILAMLNCQ